MKGYKAFNPDWTCRGKQYAVGKTTTQDGKLELCWNGIHFCRELADCFYYYSVNPDNKLAEVEALGEVLQSNEDSKCCTDRLKVVRELSIAELLKDKAFCLEVVKRDPSEIQFMKGQDREVFLEAVKQDSRTLRCVPEYLKTPEICLTAVQKYGWALRYVPKNTRTPELCLAAVQQNGLALQYVIEQTPEICKAAVLQNPAASCYIRDKTLRIKLMET